MSRIAAGCRHSLACRDDGRVLATGQDGISECQVDGWREIVVAAGNVRTSRNTGKSHSVDLRADGTAVATGWNAEGQCPGKGWHDLVQIAAGWRFTLGLLTDVAAEYPAASGSQSMAGLSPPESTTITMPHHLLADPWPDCRHLTSILGEVRQDLNFALLFDGFSDDMTIHPGMAISPS